MRNRICFLLILSAVVCSCGPSRHTVFVEKRNPSKSGLELSQKTISIVYLENSDKSENLFSEGMADGLAAALEEDYGMGEGSVGIYRMPCLPGADYSSRDTLVNLLLDTGTDVVFLIDTLSLGNMKVNDAEKVSSASSQDSSYVSTGSIPFSMRMFCYDSMNKSDKVYTFNGQSLAVPFAYSDGKTSASLIRQRMLSSLSEVGVEAGKAISSTFASQWKNEQYTLFYFDSDKWYKALLLAEDFAWKDAMDIWMSMMKSSDSLKRSCAAYNIAVACHIMGDDFLAAEWLDLSDADSQLSASETLRKRLMTR